MELIKIVAALAAIPFGETFGVELRRVAGVRKAAPIEVEKHSIVFGIRETYAELAPVAQAVAAGIRPAPKLPAWVQAVVEMDGVKFWQKEGDFYLPFPLANIIPVTQWYANGESVSLDDIESWLLAKEKTMPPSKEDLAEKGQAPFITVNVVNIIMIA